MIFDTDVFIWIQRGNSRAARLVDHEEERLLSLQTYLELLQCAQNQRQHETTKSFLKTFRFTTLPLTENIGHRAAVYIEEYRPLARPAGGRCTRGRHGRRTRVDALHQQHEALQPDSGPQDSSVQAVDPVF